MSKPVHRFRAALRALRALGSKRQRQILESWVAWLNTRGASDRSVAPLRKELSEELERFDFEHKTPSDSAKLRAQHDEWLSKLRLEGQCEADVNDPLHPACGGRAHERG